MKRSSLLRSLLLVGSLCTTQAFSQFTFVAHRGASYDAPENTLASANLAWEQNADAMELDVFLTADNQVVVFHDKTTERISGVKLIVEESTAKQLRNLDVGNWKGANFAGEKTPFLEEIIETVPEGKELVVEIKSGPAIIPALKRIAEKSRKESQLVFIAFNLNTIIQTQQAFPKNRCYWISSEEDSLFERMERAAAAGLHGVDLKHTIINDAVMQKAKELNLEIWTWTVNNVDEAKRLADIGVRAFTTDRPAWLREALTEAFAKEAPERNELPR